MGDSFDEIDLDDFEGFSDTNDQLINIYTSFINKATLLDSDRASLKKERGFSDAIIDTLKFRSCQESNKEIIEELRKEYGEEALVDAGVLEYNTHTKSIEPCYQLTSPNVVIPYFNAKGKVIFIRPHKFGLKDKGIHLYCPISPEQAPKNHTWIITESEFKAAASLQFGYPAIGLPGIHSFAEKHFHRLADFIRSHSSIKKIIIIFDNEIKNDPKLPKYKSNVLKQWDTQWRSAQLCVKLMKELPSYTKILVGVLPDEWMEDGKIDIDGALAQGRSEEDYKKVILSAKGYKKYIATLPTVAQTIITKRLHKYFFKTPIVKRDNRYYIKKPIKKKKKDDDDNGGGEEDEEDYILKPISNFLMQITKTMIEGGRHVREVIFRGEDGSVSDKQILLPESVTLRDFTRWIASCGDYCFFGDQQDLHQIYAYEYAQCDGRKIKRPDGIGFLKDENPPIWLLGNCVIKPNGEIILPEEDSEQNVIWDGLIGYQPSSIKEAASENSFSKMPIVSLDATFTKYHLYEMIEKMQKIFRTDSIKLAVGWVVACLLSDEIFKKTSFFPILFIAGRRESGKTTLGNWLMAMAGFSDISGDAIGPASEAGVTRNLAWFASLPYWLDEYRNSARITKKWDGFLRNAYQRQTVVKGTTGKKIRSHDVNSGIIVSGEETPEDNALLSRCLVIDLHPNTKRDPDPYSALEKARQEGLLSRLIVEVTKRREELLPSIYADIIGLKERLIKSKVGERVALNYAIPAACFQNYFLDDKPVSQTKEFIEWVVTEAQATEKHKESEHALNTFWDDIVTIGEELDNFYSVFHAPAESKGKRRIALHWKSFYSKWAILDRRKGSDQFKSGTLLSYIKEEKYFIEDKRPKRVGTDKKNMRCLVLSLDLEDEPPSGLLTIADQMTEEPDSDTPIDGFDQDGSMFSDETPF